MNDVIANDIYPFCGLPNNETFIENGLEIYVSPSKPRVNTNDIRVFPLKAPTTLKKSLIEHFSVCYRLGRVQWPKNMKSCVRTKTCTNH